LRLLVKEEVMEEAGFEVALGDIDYYGKYFVSSQQNQYCYMFGVTVDKHKQQLRTTKNPREIDSTITWLPASEIVNLEDWKAIVIFMKRLAASAINIKVNKL
jgi:8-oxo-dGTP pyrophosphatase MutT (NUDIX family)